MVFQEVYAYYFSIALASILAIWPIFRKYDWRLFFLFQVIFMGISLKSRFSGFDGDMTTYAASLLNNSLDFYYIREPYIWLGTRYVFSHLLSAELSFVAFDVIAGILVFLSFRWLGLPSYALFAFVCFFPFLLGQQNILRQWHASLLVLAAISAYSAKSRTFPIFLVLAPLAHNAAIIFWPLIFFGDRALASRILGWIGVFLIPLGLYIGMESKSFLSRGDEIGLAYVALILSLLMFYIWTCGKSMEPTQIREASLIFLAFFITACAFVIISPVGAERIGMFSLILIYPFIVKRIETLGAVRIPARLVLTHAGFWIIFAFSAKSFLFSDSPWM